MGIFANSKSFIDIYYEPTLFPRIYFKNRQTMSYDITYILLRINTGLLTFLFLLAISLPFLFLLSIIFEGLYHPEEHETPAASEEKSKSIVDKREQFRQYLEKEGVLEFLTETLTHLYEEQDKPTC